jgi:hypothetical protein
MKQAFRFIALVFLLALAIPAYGQNPVTSDQKNYFSLSASASGFIGGGSNQASTLAGAWLNLTQQVSIGYEMLIVPTVATYKFGSVHWQMPLSSLIGKKLTGHFLFDASKISVGFKGSVGTLSQGSVVPAVNILAEKAGITLAYPLADHISFQLLSAEWVHGGIRGTSGLVTSPSAAEISAGLGIHF